MKKILYWFIFLLILIILSLAIILATVGIETNRFNNLISQKINNINNINISLSSIKFKLNIQSMSLFLETSNPNINYRKALVPAKNVKVYIDIISLITSKPKINKINITLNELNVDKLKKLSSTFKPSNFTSFINNKIKEGRIFTDVDIFFDDENSVTNFIARGSVSNLKAEILHNINLEKMRFDFFADKSDVLIQNFFGKAESLEIKDGDLKLNLNDEVNIETNFQTKIYYTKSNSEKYIKLLKNYNLTQFLDSFEAELDNYFIIKLDKTYKIKKYDYKNNGNIINATFSFKDPLQSIFIEEKIHQLSLNNSEIKTNLSKEINNLKISGNYALNNKKLEKFDLENNLKKNLLEFKLNAGFSDTILVDLLNYRKRKNIPSNIYINFNKQKKNINFNELKFSEKKNLISIKGLKLNNNKFKNLEKITVKTFKDGKKNNDFIIKYGNKILIEGDKFDALNLPKILNKNTNKNNFSNINKKIEINLNNINAPLSEKLKNFKLIGELKGGKFTKISSKGEFGENNFLDITMKDSEKDKKKYLEIYSDLTKPLLTEFSFFKGLTGGKLLYTSVIDVNSSSSKLKIENFKVVNAPGMVKILSLADLGGLADLAEGEGISFEILEIGMEKKGDILKLNEILAIGPSISVLMEGYQDSKTTSIRGTLVPAKTLNKMISKIPLIGDIVIPKEVGEGLFGISFKMKGPPGKVKTTINPIRTITPRFIQKIIDKKKNTK